MLLKVKTLQTYSLLSLDGEIGKVKNVYFDDQRWGVHYLLADTGDWLIDRQVLISPQLILAVSEAEQTISVNLTQREIEDGPVLGTNEKISQAFEKSYFSYYGWPDDGQGPQTDNLELHMTKEMLDYQIQAKDGALGHIDGFMLDLDSWTIRYLVVNTQNWWPGKKTLISPTWIESVSWQKSTVCVKYLCETIRQAPEYKGIAQLSPEAEIDLSHYYEWQGYYNRKGYWIDELLVHEYSLN